MDATTGEVLLRLRCHGHPQVRATHGKTLEFAAAPQISARATCVVGVAAQAADAAAQPAAPAPGRHGLGARPAGADLGAPLAGPVRLRLRAGDAETVVHALANPLWHPERGIVVRRSGNRFADTLATDADAAAADLPREMISRLADPAQVLEVVVERAHPAAGPARLILMALADEPGAVARLLAEAEAADAVVAEDPAAQALLRGLAVAAGSAPGAAVPAEGLAAGSRVLVAAGRALPGRSVLPLLGAPARAAVEVAGLAPALAAAAASPSRAPVLLLDGAGAREARALARAAPAATRLVVRARAAEVAAICRAAPSARPAAAVTVVPEAAHQRERVLRLAPEQISDMLPGQARVACCLDAAPAEPGTGPAAPFGGAGRVAELLAALSAEGIPARTLAGALGRVPGWSRNQAYDFVRGLARREDRTS